VSAQSQLPPSSPLRHLVDSFFAVVFPTDCSLCRRELVTAGWINICPGCWEHVEFWTGASCERCGVPFASELAAHEDVTAPSDAGICGRCRNGEYEFDLARSYGLYTGNLRAAILQLKFKHRERLGYRLGQLLTRTFERIKPILPRGNSLAQRALLMPVPLHSARQRERGFNQSELLVRGLTKTIASPGSRSQKVEFAAARKARSAGLRPVSSEPRKDWPIDVDRNCLRRVRATIPQSGLSLAARRENVRGVFEVLKPSLIRDRTIILVDDVMTTGATVSACAAVLKRAGARYVAVLALAHAAAQFPDTMHDAS
jgi:predicted amidophosphoribosyltransferase